MKSLCIYEWRAGRRYLLPTMFPEATHVRARLGETSSDLLKRLPPGIEAFLFHVNLTDTRRTPLRRRAFCRALRARGIRILNEHVTDISKHHVQHVCALAGLRTTIAPRDGDPDEMLILKTSANYGGENEKRLDAGVRRRLGFAQPTRLIRGFDGYLIRRRKEVRPEFWRSRQVIVERFIENRHHVFYRAHKLLDRVIVSRMVNPARIKKMLQQIRRTNWNLHLPSLEPVEGPRPVPMHVVRAVSSFCAAARLDAGSIDIMEDDEGRCYVVDLNAQPYWGRETGYDHMLRYLAGGLTSAGAVWRSSSEAR